MIRQKNRSLRTGSKLFLSVVRVRAVLAEVVLADNVLRERYRRGINLLGQEGHGRHFFQNSSIVDRLERGRAPGKGTMPGYEYHGHLRRIKVSLPESFNDQVAGFSS